MRRRSALSGIACAAVLSLSCASTAPPPSHDLDAALRARNLDPAAIVHPLRVNEEMLRWVHAAVPKDIDPEQRLRRLLLQITSSGGLGLGLVYERGNTGTAEEVFVSRRANCVAFTNLFVALARELGLEVGFLLVADTQSFTREGDLVVASDHLTAVYRGGPDRLVLDFTPGTPADYRNTTDLDDLTALGLFYSNLGVAEVRAGTPVRAVEYLRTAAALAPFSGTTWTNLGVALRRSGDADGAEAAYRRALEADPETLSAYQNLAALLRIRGRAEEASALLALVDRRDNRNPFSFLELGDLAVRHGRPEEGVRFYRRALRIDEQCVDARAAMGEAALAAGRRSEARKWLRKARSLEPENVRVRALAHRLAAADARG